MAIPVPEKRIARFEKLGFGMFIHWGLYSQLGRGEWVQFVEKIPKEEYAKLKDTFTAKEFNGREIAKIAKRAGMNYITLTTRHHEGFSLYDTRGLNDYDAPHSPAGRDLIKDFVEGCRAEGILPMFYHTTLDWYNDDFNGNFKEYLKYLRRSVEILCTEYGEIGGLWFDGNWSKPNDDWEEDELYSLIRRNQPDAMIINNTGLDARGFVGNSYLDSVTFEQGRPTPMNREGMPKYLAAEMCQTINGHWGIGTIDFNYQSLPELIENLCACRKVGANYLLNVGPTAEGKILPLQAELLAAVGDWIRATGDAIYNGKPCDIKSSGKDFVLFDGEKYWFYIHDLTIKAQDNVVKGVTGVGARSFTDAKVPFKSIKWVDNGEELNFTQNTENGLLCVDCTGYPYGTNMVVRVAVADAL